MRPRRRAALLISGAVVLLGVGRSARADEADCGTMALYYLLQFEGKPRTLDEVRAALPARDERGYSLRELADAAARFGLNLSGVRALDLDHAPDRPLIAFLKRPEHGHFVLVRPLGHTGHLVQVLDGLNPPDVLDMTAFRAEQGWTGLGLVPGRRGIGPGWPLLGAVVLLGLAWARGRARGWGRGDGATR